MTSEFRSFAKALLDPDSVALVGVSGDPKKNTARPLRFMRRHGYGGRIFPVNAARRRVMDEPAWPSVDALPQAVDHVFVMVSADQVMDVLEQSARNGARVVTIYSDGFGESGPQGRDRQRELIERAGQLGVRILGPNSIGIANLHSGAIVSVNAVFEMHELRKGHAAIVSQSGSMMGSLLSRAASRGMGFAKSVSVGNESDISVGEVVDALVDDPQTKVILLFLETIRDAGILAAALNRARAACKPVIVYKLGRSEAGDALAQSHTGAMAGNDAAVDAFLHAHGAVRVPMLETLFEAAPLLLNYPAADLPAERAPRVATITTTGGGAATVVDNLSLRGLHAVSPPLEFIAEMAQLGLTIKPSPIIDLTLAATSDQYRILLERLLRSDWCDAVLSVGGSSAQFHPELVLQPLISASKSEGKPLVVFFSPDAPESLHRMHEHGLAAFRTPEACADALSAYFKRRAAITPRVQSPWSWPADAPVAEALNEYEALQVFSDLGIPTVKTERLVDGGNEIRDVMFPVVVKVLSRDIVHKTDAGGVKVGIGCAAALDEAIAQVRDNARAAHPGARIEGVLVQEMKPRLLELILGYRLDPMVGPTVLLGAGGITAELAPDFSLRIAPVSFEQAWEMILEVRQTRLIRGYRNLPPGDCAALARAVSDFSRLAECGKPIVLEAEINPLFVNTDGIVAVDGLLRMRVASAD
jgi:acyl-CoA synthetase (NDP forming)